MWSIATHSGTQLTTNSNSRKSGLKIPAPPLPPEAREAWSWVPAGAPALLTQMVSSWLPGTHRRGTRLPPALPQARDDVQELGTTLGPWLLFSGWGMRGTFGQGPSAVPSQPLTEQWGGEGCAKCPLQERGDIFVRKGHNGVKPSKHSPLLSASVS